MKGAMKFWEDGLQIELAISGSASYFQNNFCAVQQGKTSFLKSIAQKIAQNVFLDFWPKIYG